MTIVRMLHKTTDCGYVGLKGGKIEGGHVVICNPSGAVFTLLAYSLRNEPFLYFTWLLCLIDFVIMIFIYDFYIYIWFLYWHVFLYFNSYYLFKKLTIPIMLIISTCTRKVYYKHISKSINILYCWLYTVFN